jgi:hypothetical protein
MNGYAGVLKKTSSIAMTIIEIRLYRNGWQVYESPGVHPVFLNQEQAIDYATGHSCFRSGEIRILKSNGTVERIIPFNETDRRL